jgi:hypothetical protein
MESVVVTYPRYYYKGAVIGAVLFPLVTATIAGVIWTVGPAQCAGQTVENSFGAWGVLASVLMGMGLLGSAVVLYDGREVRWATVALGSDGILFRSRTKTEEILIGDIRRAVWRCRPAGGSLALVTPAGKRVVRFDLARGAHRLAAIRRLREILPADVQQNRPEFCRTFGLRLLRSLEPDRPPRPTKPC